MRTDQFGAFIEELEEEAKAEGPDAREELAAFLDYFRRVRERLEDQIGS